MLHVVNDLLLASDSGKVSLLTLLDLFDAFDTINHSILLSHLDHTESLTLPLPGSSTICTTVPNSVN